MTVRAVAALPATPAERVPERPDGIAGRGPAAGSAEPWDECAIASLPRDAAAQHGGIVHATDGAGPEEV